MKIHNPFKRLVQKLWCWAGWRYATCPYKCMGYIGSQERLNIK
jgi:hypothetical protein